MNKKIVTKIFPKEVELVEKMICPFCKKSILNEYFKDYISMKEYLISGLCQSCQNKIF